MTVNMSWPKQRTNPFSTIHDHPKMLAALAPRQIANAGTFFDYKDNDEFKRILYIW